MATGNPKMVVRNDQYQSLLAIRTFPVLFAVVCFLVIANTSCDSVGTANEETKDLGENESSTSTSSSSTTTTVRPSNKPKTKIDPLSMLREIYLGHDNKILTMILPTGNDSVQKFHPNGRYGRRSVNNLAEPLTHVELGKLNNYGDDNPGPLRSILHNINSVKNENNKFAESNRYNSDLNDVSEMEQELNKLLRCNYTGVSNLYWCNTNN